MEAPVIRITVRAAGGDTPRLELRTADPLLVDYSAQAFERLADVFQHDAQLVVDALFATLPGGTLDRILPLLLMRKASYLIMAYTPRDTPRVVS